MSLASILQLGNSVGVGTRALCASLAMSVACAAFAAPPAVRDIAPPKQQQVQPQVKPQAAPPATRPSVPAPSAPRVEPKPREVAPAKPVERPAPRKPVEAAPIKPREIKPRETEPRQVTPAKPIDVAPERPAPRKPIDAPSKAPIVSPKSPKGGDIDGASEITPRPRPVRDDAPIVRPTNPPVKRPDPVVVRTPRPVDDVRNETPRPKAPPAMPRELGKPSREHISADAKDCCGFARLHSCGRRNCGPRSRDCIRDDGSFFEGQ